MDTSATPTSLSSGGSTTMSSSSSPALGAGVPSVTTSVLVSRVVQELATGQLDAHLPILSAAIRSRYREFRS